MSQALPADQRRRRDAVGEDFGVVVGVDRVLGAELGDVRIGVDRRSSPANTASSLGERRGSGPGVVLMSVKERTRSGYPKAAVWQIMPPIDTPTRWAASMPTASSTPIASPAMSWIP